MSEPQATSGTYLGPGLMLGLLFHPLLTKRGAQRQSTRLASALPLVSEDRRMQSRSWELWQSNGSFIHISEVALHVFPWCLGSGMKPF